MKIGANFDISSMKHDGELAAFARRFAQIQTMEKLFTRINDNHKAKAKYLR